MVKMALGVLGPEGTFSHQAAAKFPGYKVVFAAAIEDLFELYRQKVVDKILVPIENSLSGTVIESLDELMDCGGNILAEEILSIEHQLASFVKKGEVKTVFAHPHSYRQCRSYLNGAFLDTEVIFTNSNADSAQRLLEDREKAAAIINETSAGLYQLPLIAKEIQDKKNNQTRFLLIGEGANAPSGSDKTSLLIRPNEDKCGILSEILLIFVGHQLNLTKIESRPSKEELGQYHFFIDFEGHCQDNSVKKALSELEAFATYKLLGSYPKKYEQERKSQESAIHLG